MPRNVEIKARVHEPDQLRSRALALANGRCEVIHQQDTFYVVSHGRLKLREFGDGTGELIAYSRPDRTGPKTSAYAICPAPDPAGLHQALSLALGVSGTVTKERVLVLCGRTRIHLDRVAGLGDFMELEVVLNENEPEADGRREARELMQHLGVAEADLVEGAYLDLLDAWTDGGGQGVD